MQTKFEKYYGELNKEQKRAVDMTDGPLLVLAGPGTGKTQLLSVRAANIIKKGACRPENILILTYTNAATKAMKERLVEILGKDAYNIETATFHSFANSVILESDEAAEYIQERMQLTDIERIKLLEYILDNTEGIDAVRPFRARYIFEREIAARMGDLKKEGVTPEAFEKIAAKLRPDGKYIEEKHIKRLSALAIIYRLYEEYKAGKNKDLFDERGRYDYDDMIIFALVALRNEPELKDAMQKQYTYIMVDEFQDTNGAQKDLLFELGAVNVCCVGDDDQSIFRFQGASLENFRELKKRFPALKEIALEKNYRSTKEIISLAESIINILPEKERVCAKVLRPEKEYGAKNIKFCEFSTETEELLFITDSIKKLEGVPLDEIAVLVRVRDDILRVVDAFLRAGIPYATDGKEDIAGEKRVRQMLDVLRFAHTPDTEIEQKDSYLYRILTSDYMRISMNDVIGFIRSVRAKKIAQRKKSEPVTISMFSEFMENKGAGLSAGKPYKALSGLLHEAEVRPVHSVLLQYVEESGLYKYILEEYDDNEVLRIRDLRGLTSFLNMVKDTDISRPGITLKDFLDEIESKEMHGLSLQGDLVTAQQEGVRIYTAHASKGLEFQTVFIPFCLEKKRWPKRPLPSSIRLPPEIYKSKDVPTDKDMLKQREYFDETRLFYVASTRAKSDLIYTASPTESSVISSYLSAVPEKEVKKKEEDLLRASLESTKAKGPFIGTEKALKSIIADITLNPTAINNYINCARKYLYDNVLMLPGKKRQPLIFGNCVHKALEDTFNEYLRSGKFPGFDLFKKSFIRELGHQGPDAAIKTACLRQVDTLKGWFDEESRAPVKPLGLERHLYVMLGDDLVFTGNYDKTEPLEGSFVRVVDYKTGLPDDHVKGINNSIKEGTPISSGDFENYLRQLIAYKLLFDKDKKESKGQTVKEGVLVFLEPAKDTVIKHGLEEGEYVKKEVELTGNMVSELERVIRDIWCRIKRCEFPKLPERVDDFKKCKGCDFDDICWD